MATESGKWISGAEACRVLDLPDNRALAPLVAEGLVQKRLMPGCRGVYRKSDCEQLARLAILPVRPQTEGAASA